RSPKSIGVHNQEKENIPMTIELPGVVTVVTGAAGGIGRALCSALKAAGATVVATDLAADGNGVVADDYLQHDVTDADAWRRVADLVNARYGRLDARVHNAGTSMRAKFDDTSLEGWHNVPSITAAAIVVGTQIMLPLLKAGGKERTGGASIATFPSVGGQRGTPFSAAYNSSKAAVKMLSKC